MSNRLKAIILSVLFTGYVNAEEPNFSFTTKEFHIPIVNVDNGKSYSVEMIQIDDKERLVFAVVDAKEIPFSKESFESIQNGMTRNEVIEILGVPQKIKNLEIKEAAFCDEPPLNVGSVYEQWEYDVDASSQIPSGYVVWFSGVNNSTEWEVVGKIDGFGCM